MNELDLLNNNFNEELEKIEPASNNFSLTKMFKNGNLKNTIVNTLLCLSVTMGSFSATANDFLKSENLENQEVVQMVADSQTPMQSLRTEILGEYTDPKILTLDNFEEITNNQASGIYKDSQSGEMLIFNFQENPNTEMNEDLAPLFDLLEINKAHTNFSFAISDLSHSDFDDFQFINISNKEMVDLFPEPNKTFPVFHKVEDLWTMAHEYAHLNKYQVEEAEQFYNNSFMFKLPAVLYKEIDSDLNGIMLVSNMKNLSLEETTQLTRDVAKFRKSLFENYGDTDHASHMVLENFADTLEKNPTFFVTLKNQGFDSMNKFISKYSLISYNEINKKEYDLLAPEETLTLEMFQKDLKALKSDYAGFSVRKNSTLKEYKLDAYQAKDYEKLLKSNFDNMDNKEKLQEVLDTSDSAYVIRKGLIEQMSIHKKIKETNLENTKLEKFALTYTDFEAPQRQRYEDVLLLLKEEVATKLNKQSEMKQKQKNEQKDEPKMKLKN